MRLEECVTGGIAYVEELMYVILKEGEICRVILERITHNVIISLSSSSF